ncbi:MAG TPA: sugar phosphate isomerase/epimerase family protein [Verrucomicrobiae bacterium]|nr:sugar phosphate isomerase/epimerase family protein [Verrucomicrobiae bacterium]
MKLNRRHFLNTAGLLGGAALTAGSVPLPVLAAAPARKPQIKLGVATYSYWHFSPQKVPIETVMDKAAALGVSAVDILHRQMDLEEKAPLDDAGRAYLRKLKQHAFHHGLGICCLSTHQTFLKPEADVRAANVAHTEKCIEIAYELGCPCLRINTGTWGTSKDFDDLMAHHGVEPVLPGYTEEDGFKWAIDGITRCLAKAEACGVTLALENHWGLARTPEGLLRILNRINSPWLGALMDTGNFLFPPYKDAAYDKLAQIAPKAVYVQVKTYPGGGEWYTLNIDYRRVAKILADAGYTGFVSLEMEGKQDPDVAVPKSIAMLRKAFA